VNSCLSPTAQCAGGRITTIEGLGSDEKLHRLQRAFLECGGAQCGICTPGMILAAAVLPKKAKLAEVRTALAGNICRCTGYEGIYRAVRKAGVRSPKSLVRRRSKSPVPSRGTAEGRGRDK